MHGGVKWTNGKPSTVKDYSVNLNPLGVPKFIQELIEDAVKMRVYEFYPDDYRELRRKIAEVYDVDEELVGVFNGASEAISLLNRGYFVPEPNYQEYPRASVYLAEEAQTFNFPLYGDKVIASHPNNPTGAPLLKEEVISFLQERKELVIDQSFADISPVESFVKLVKEFPNLLIVSSFTKSFSIPGLRLGFTLGSASSSLEKRSIPWRVNSIAYYVFVNLDVRETRNFFYRSKEEVNKRLSSLERIRGVHFYNSYAPYVLAESFLSAEKLNEKLLELGYQVRNCSNFVGLRATHFRFSLKSGVNELLRAIGRILDSSRE
ncbi:aminotransferase class I/II-fold pyridoxal phosphate-dependent enzyme [Metallosphaera hakonensis]|nr:histidinol-phosphate transaminase [Metallosphaera hakonensis]